MNVVHVGNFVVILKIFHGSVYGLVLCWNSSRKVFSPVCTCGCLQNYYERELSEVRFESYRVLHWLYERDYERIEEVFGQRSFSEEEVQAIELSGRQVSRQA